jgi:hypothetical protein
VCSLSFASVPVQFDMQILAPWSEVAVPCAGEVADRGGASELDLGLARLIPLPSPKWIGGDFDLQESRRTRKAASSWLTEGVPRRERGREKRMGAKKREGGEGQTFFFLSSSSSVSMLKSSLLVAGDSR